MIPADFFKKVSEQEADEHAHQAALFCWIANNLHNDARLGLMFAIPNGGERNKIVAARMTAEGVRQGIPDTFLPVALSGYHGLFIEMKRPSARYKSKAPKDKWDTGGVSDAQKIKLTQLEQQGYKCVVCYHWYEAANEIKFYLTGKGLDDV
jgi:hypothetical protein